MESLGAPEKIEKWTGFGGGINRWTSSVKGAATIDFGAGVQGQTSILDLTLNPYSNFYTAALTLCLPAILQALKDLQNAGVLRQKRVQERN